MTGRRSRWLSPILDLPRPLLLAFDVDGTLAPIVRVPSRARVPSAVVSRLERLAAVARVHVAVITGRDPASLAQILPLSQIYRGVLHGKLVLPPGRTDAPLRISSSGRRALAQFEDYARAQLAGRGVVLEPKPGAFTVHVRQLAERDPERAKERLRAARSRAAELGLEVRDGRAAVEVETRHGDKGEALMRIQRASRARGVVFLGDDLTDLPALRYASQVGIGLFVRSGERPRRPNGLSGSVSGVSEVHSLIEQLEQRFLHRDS